VRSGPVDEVLVEEVAGFLNVDRSRIVAAEWVDNGPGWLGILFASAEEVLALEPVTSYSRRMDIGVIGPFAEGDVKFELRTFFSNHVGAIVEDPVTGSFQASAAQWMIGSGRAQAPYVTAQGTKLGRRGRAYVEQESGSIWIGGDTQTLCSGEATFARQTG